MRLLGAIVVALALLVGTSARADGDGPFGISGVALPPGGAFEAAAWRRNGKQILTIDENNMLLFWDAASRRLIDTMTLGTLPPRPTGSGAPRRVTLRISPDSMFAAVTVLPSGRPAVTLLVDLVAEKVTETIDRPALFWIPTGVVAGPHAGCTVACDFAVIDPRTTHDSALGIGFGDGRVVAAMPDGSRFVSVVAVGGRQELVVWTTTTWTPLVHVPLASDVVVEVGFDQDGSHAFARQATPQVVVVGVADGRVETSSLPPQAAGMAFATDVDRRRVMTPLGPIPFDSNKMSARMDFFTFYAADPRYGAIYTFNDGLAAAIGARPAAPNAFPWQVELQYRAPPGSGFSPLVLHNCGGSLIRAGWVLTATHCFLTADNLLRSDAEAQAHTVVRAGSTELDAEMKNFDVVGVYIRRCTQTASNDCFHDYDPAAQPPVPPLNDITLLRIVPHVEPVVGRSFTLQAVPTGQIKPIRLPAPSVDIRPPSPVTMTGWGATSVGNAQERVMSASLNRIDITVMPREVCSRRHGFGPLAPTLICAGSADDAQLACKGDSGGPLVADVAKRPVLVGIVSWGNCTGGPAIYTSVAAFVPWINATIAAAEAHR